MRLVGAGLQRSQCLPTCASKPGWYQVWYQPWYQAGWLLRRFWAQLSCYGRGHLGRFPGHIWCRPTEMGALPGAWDLH